MAANNKRLLLDIKYIQENETDGIILSDAEDIRSLEAIICGPTDSPYATGLFTVEVKVPPQYPVHPPKIRFTTPIYHPNVSKFGSICLDVLKEEWTPGMTILMALEAVQGLLRDPNMDSPLHLEAGEMMRSDRQMFDETARTWTHHYAGGHLSVPSMEAKIRRVTEITSDKDRAIRLLTKNKWMVLRIQF